MQDSMALSMNRRCEGFGDNLCVNSYGPGEYLSRMSFALYAASVMTVNRKSVVGIHLEEKAKIAGRTLAGESQSTLRARRRQPRRPDCFASVRCSTQKPC
jgi:hypothetical protein